MVMRCEDMSDIIAHLSDKTVIYDRKCIAYFQASGSGFDGSVAVDDPSTHNRRHDSSRKLPPVKGRVLRLGKRLCSLKGPPLLRIEEGDVTKVAAAKRPPSSQVEAARRTGC